MNPITTKAMPDTGRAAKPISDSISCRKPSAERAGIERHRMINAALASELKGSVHALAIYAQAPGETV